MHFAPSQRRKKQRERQREREMWNVSKHWSWHAGSSDGARQLHSDLAPSRQGTTIIKALCSKFAKKGTEREERDVICVEALIVTCWITRRSQTITFWSAPHQGTTIINAFCCKFAKKETEREREREREREKSKSYTAEKAVLFTM